VFLITFMWTFPADRHFFLRVIFNFEASIRMILASLPVYPHKYISVILFFEPRTVLQY